MFEGFEEMIYLDEALMDAEELIKYCEQKLAHETCEECAFFRNGKCILHEPFLWDFESIE